MVARTLGAPLSPNGPGPRRAAALAERIRAQREASRVVPPCPPPPAPLAAQPERRRSLPRPSAGTFHLPALLTLGISRLPLGQACLAAAAARGSALPLPRPRLVPARIHGGGPSRAPSARADRATRGPVRPRVRVRVRDPSHLGHDAPTPRRAPTSIGPGPRRAPGGSVGGRPRSPRYPATRAPPCC